MKIYVFMSAAHFIEECTDIMDVQVFTTEEAAVKYLEDTVADHISEEGGWTIFSKLPKHYQLTCNNEEYVACVAEREI